MTHVCYYPEKHVFWIRTNSTVMCSGYKSTPVIPISHKINHLTTDLAGILKCITMGHWGVKGYMTQCVMVKKTVIDTVSMLSFIWHHVASHTMYTNPTSNH